MLKPTSKEQRRLLELADFIQTLSYDQFSMGQWGGNGEPRCICGWFMHNHCLAHDDWRTAGKMLGLTEHEASKLFKGDVTKTTETAAAELRQLAWMIG